MEIVKINNENAEYSWKVDVPVVINFFARPDALQKVFDRVKEVKPKYLFLLADGPRKGRSDDDKNCKACREIVEDVDWDCELYHIYAASNKGLFDTYFDGMRLVFEIVDRCIFLEDDLVVSKSFFPFCAELLEKYKDDQRISFITSMNYFGVYSKPSADYFFSGEGSIWGYALWKRTFESMKLDFINDEYTVNAINDVAHQIKNGYQKRINRTVKNPNWEGHVPHVEFYKNTLRFLQNQVCIVPTKNMLCCVGIGGSSVHTADSINKMPKRLQGLYNAEIYEIDGEIKHPKYVVRDIYFEKYVNSLLAFNMPLKQFLTKSESLVRHIIYGDWERIIQKIKGVFVRDNWT